MGTKKEERIANEKFLTIGFKEEPLRCAKFAACNRKK